MQNLKQKSHEGNSKHFSISTVTKFLNNNQAVKPKHYIKPQFFTLRAHTTKNQFNEENRTKHFTFNRNDMILNLR